MRERKSVLSKTHFAPPPRTHTHTHHFKAYYFKVVFYIVNPELHH